MADLSFSEAATADEPDKIPQSEIKDAEKWAKTVREARAFDENARKGYARDRAYAKNDSSPYEVDVPVASSYIDIKTAFLYARNPDLDIQPAATTEPPPMADIMEMARQQIAKDPRTHQMMEQVGIQATQQAEMNRQQAVNDAAQTAMGDSTAPKNLPAPQPPPEMIGEMAAQAWLNATVKKRAKEIMAPYRERQAQAKQFGDTLERVIRNQWQKARLKKAAKKWVRSAATVGCGWLKASWQERQGWDPVTAKLMDDAVAQANRIAALEAEIQRGDVKDLELANQELADLKTGMNENVEQAVDRSLVFDFVRAEDIQVAPGVDLEDYLDAEWIDHRVYMPLDKAKESFPDVADRMQHATVYYQRKKGETADKGRNLQREDSGWDANEADQFTTGGMIGGTGKDNPHVCVHETWDKVAHLVRTTIEGLKGYACKPYLPDPGTTRFYGFFYLAFLEVDGERHPQSFTERSRKLLDEVNRQYSAFAEHRRRSVPKTAFNAGDLSKEEAEKIEKGGTQELIALRPTDPAAKISDLVHTITYAGIDKALYDDSNTFQKLEINWAIQEALASGRNPVSKTATEAEIQQAGTGARTSAERDPIDVAMDEIAVYTAEVVLQKMSLDEVKDVVGPWAFWPQGMTMTQLPLLLTIQIDAGSTGKPDTVRRQQAWSITFPVINRAIEEIGALRQSTPDDIADCKEELLVETLNRSGERLEPSRFVPPPPSQEPGNMPSMPGMPGGMPPGGAPNPVAQVPPSKSTANHTPRPLHAPPPTPNPQVPPIPHGGHVNGLPLPGVSA